MHQRARCIKMCKASNELASLVESLALSMPAIQNIGIMSDTMMRERSRR
jgi:hypothetical protein